MKFARKTISDIPVICLVAAKSGGHIDIVQLLEKAGAKE
jgi:hypothetical protein